MYQVSQSKYGVVGEQFGPVKGVDVPYDLAD